MSEIFDLDAVTRPDLRVKLGDTQWRIPGSMDSQFVAHLAMLFKELEKAADAEDEDRTLEISGEIREHIEGLFAHRHTEKELEALPSMNDDQLAELYVHVVNSWATGDDEEPARPTKPTARKPKSGGRSRASSSSRKTRSRSSTSSSS